jgi:hypothetical protein
METITGTSAQRAFPAEPANRNHHASRPVADDRQDTLAD